MEEENDFEKVQICNLGTEKKMFRDWTGRNQNNIFTSVVILFFGLMAVACNFTSLVPLVPAPTETMHFPEVDLGSIGGYVWNDLCVSNKEIDGIPPGCVVDGGSDRIIADGIYGNAEKGIPNIQVSIGKGICPSRGHANVISNGNGFYKFEGLAAGEYCISVNHPEGGQLAKVVAGTWTYPRTDRGIGVGWMTLTLSKGEIRKGVNFGWDYLLQPFSPEPEPTFTPTPQPICSNEATFIADVMISDGARFSQGEEFNKVWRLKNVGTCTWNTEYSLVFTSGDRMSGLDTFLNSEEVPPGSEVELGVSLIAPEVDGSYKGYWMLESDRGEAFGIGKSADKPFWVQIAVGKGVSRDSVVSWTYELNPENLANEGRWVDVDLGQQVLTAYEGSTPIMRFIVSTGTAAHPTVTGQFRIWVKLATTNMSGPGYSLEDVPYTMYFYQGYGLHGTFWHNNFGTPMSHGCVNLRTPDAAWLFDFVSEGTLVNVHL